MVKDGWGDCVGRYLLIFENKETTNFKCVLKFNESGEEKMKFKIQALKKELKKVSSR